MVIIMKYNFFTLKPFYILLFFFNKKYLINSSNHMKIESSEEAEHEFVPEEKIIQTLICLNS